MVDECIAGDMRELGRMNIDARNGAVGIQLVKEEVARENHKVQVICVLCDVGQQ